jgi:nucleoside-diphosphate-sugar epimerase
MLDHLLAATQAPIFVVSSMTVYGSETSSVMRREEDAGWPDSAYGRAKLAAEERLISRGRSGFAIRLPGLFGGGRRGGLVAAVLRAFRDGTAPHLPDVPILWAGMHVSDAADAIAALAERPATGFTPINIGYKETMSITRLAAHAAALFGKDAPASVAQPDFQFDQSRAQQLGISVNGTLRDALERAAKELET